MREGRGGEGREYALGILFLCHQVYVICFHGNQVSAVSYLDTLSVQCRSYCAIASVNYATGSMCVLSAKNTILTVY